MCSFFSHGQNSLCNAASRHLTRTLNTPYLMPLQGVLTMADLFFVFVFVCVCACGWAFVFCLVVFSPRHFSVCHCIIFVTLFFLWTHFGNRLCDSGPSRLERLLVPGPLKPWREINISPEELWTLKLSSLAADDKQTCYTRTNIYIPGPHKRSPFSACAYKLPQHSTLPLKSECAYIFKRRPPLRVFACLHLFECGSEIVKRPDFGRCLGVQVYTYM